MNQQKKITSTRQSKVSAIIIRAYHIAAGNNNLNEKLRNKEQTIWGVSFTIIKYMTSKKRGSKELGE